jgi:hypothetical protein
MPEFWVQSDVMPDGSYGASITVDSDTAFALDEPTATTYAAGCFAAAMTADHCCGVMRMMTEIGGLSAEEATDYVRLYATLAPIPVGPLRFVPTVGRAKHPRPDAGSVVPAVEVLHDGRKLGWVDPNQLRDHAAGVLDALAAARLDGQLKHMLTETIGLGEDHAAMMVGDLSRFLPCAMKDIRR